MRQYIMPIIESGGVDLLLTGHSHIYERSMLIDGAYVLSAQASGAEACVITSPVAVTVIPVNLTSP